MERPPTSLLKMNVVAMSRLDVVVVFSIGRSFLLEFKTPLLLSLSSFPSVTVLHCSLCGYSTNVSIFYGVRLWVRA